MAKPQVSMDFDAVQKIANAFATSGDLLEKTDSVVELAVSILGTTAFTGLVGNALIAQHLQQLEPTIKALSAACKEMNLDLIGAIASVDGMDTDGRNRFVAS